MAERYAISSGSWIAARFDGGTLPGVSDDVYANNFTVTIDTNITVASLRTTAGTTAVAGGAFATSGTRTVNADTYAGSTSCLTLTANTHSVQNGNSFASQTTGSVPATIVSLSCCQIGNSTGGNAGSRIATSVLAGGLQIGNSTGGSGVSTAYGTNLSAGAVQQGDSFGGTVAVGTNAAFGSIQIGNSTGGAGASGTFIAAGSIQVGNATGGTVSGAHGSTVATGGYLIQCIATGTTAGAFGVQGVAGSTVVITSEVGSFPKSLNALARTNYDWVPFFEPSSGRIMLPFLQQVIG